MTIAELADILGIELRIYRIDSLWRATLVNVEVKEKKESSVLASECGFGNDPLHALADYVERIREKWLVVNAAGGPLRREFGVPPTITY